MLHVGQHRLMTPHVNRLKKHTQETFQPLPQHSETDHEVIGQCCGGQTGSMFKLLPHHPFITPYSTISVSYGVKK